MDTSKTKFAVLEKAIQSGRRIGFMYGGKYREVYPHILTNRDGSWRVYGVRIRHDTSSLPFAKPEWQALTLDRMTGNIVIFEGEQDHV